MARRLKLDLPQLDRQAIGNHLRGLMVARGVDVESLAAEVGLSKRKLRRILGGRGALSLEVAFQLSKALGTTVEGFVFLKGEF